jgi:hypothetical protein
MAVLSKTFIFYTFILRRPGSGSEFDEFGSGSGFDEFGSRTPLVMAIKRYTILLFP